MPVGPGLGFRPCYLPTNTVRPVSLVRVEGIEFSTEGQGSSDYCPLSPRSFEIAYQL